MPEKDGLKEDWKYARIFVNPPYGRDEHSSIYDWINKAVDSKKVFGAEVILLIPVATNTKHFKDLIFKDFTSICFLADTRLKFYNQGAEDKKGAPMACCLIYIGNNKEFFEKCFSVFGKVFHI